MFRPFVRECRSTRVIKNLRISRVSLPAKSLISYLTPQNTCQDLYDPARDIIYLKNIILLNKIGKRVLARMY